MPSYLINKNISDKQYNWIIVKLKIISILKYYLIFIKENNLINEVSSFIKTN